MARSKVVPDLIELNNLSVFKDTLSLTQLTDRVEIPSNKNINRSLEQKIIALKILMLNDMKYTMTGKVVGVTKETLASWWRTYGVMMTKTNPSQEIAQQVENDLAGLMSEIYTASRDLVKKMSMVADKASAVKDLYPMAEVFKSYSALIIKEIESKKTGDGKIPGGDWYMNIHNMMIKNTYGDGNED